MAHAFQFGADLHEIWLSRTPHGYELHCKGAEHAAVALRPRGEHLHELVVGEEVWPVYVAVHGDDIHVHLNGESHTLTYSHSLERFSSQRQERSEALAYAPMPGAVIGVQVQAGQAVKRGDTMIVIESMKMETAILAGANGVVKEVHVQLGQNFERDTLLVTLDPAEAKE